MNAKLPKHVVFQGRGLNHAGPGRSMHGPNITLELRCFESLRSSRK